jgi:hypothetical protein
MASRQKLQGYPMLLTMVDFLVLKLMLRDESRATDRVVEPVDHVAAAI